MKKTKLSNALSMLSSSEKKLTKSRGSKKLVGGHFDLEVSKQLKYIEIEDNRTLQDMLAEAINDFFEKNGKLRIAKKMQ